MDLNQLRNEINALDDQLLALFLQRMDVVEQVARYKIQADLPVLHPGREAEILDRVTEKAASHYPAEARSFFEALMAISREMQTKLIADSKQPH